jgi:hypothetical protein
MRVPPVGGSAVGKLTQPQRIVSIVLPAGDASAELQGWRKTDLVWLESPPRFDIEFLASTHNPPGCGQFGSLNQ